MNNGSRKIVNRIMLISLVMVAAVVMMIDVSTASIHAATNNTQRQTQVRQNVQAQSRNSQYHQIMNVAKSKLGHRYAYGAVGPNRFDCSGFTSYIYRKGINKRLPRTAQAQYARARHVTRRNRRRGDLVFFGSSRRNISHVGMYVGNGKMIDAQNRGVVVEKINVPWWHTVGYARPVNLQ